MLSAINVLALALASGIVGLWVRGFLLDLGIIQDFNAGLWACAFFAAAFAAGQLLYRAVLLLLKPTRAISFTVSDILSNVCALILVPSLVGLRITLPYAVLQPFEPLLHVAVFGILLLFFRLMTFFAVSYGEKSSRMITVPWLSFLCLACLFTGISAYKYLQTISLSREFFKAETIAFAADNQYADAYKVPESKRVVIPIRWGDGDLLTLLCAPGTEKAEFPEKLFLTIEAFTQELPEAKPDAYATPAGMLTKEIVLNDVGWTSVEIDYNEMPRTTVSIAVSWHTQDPRGLLQRLGLLQDDTKGRVLMVSGPWKQNLSKGSDNPSIIILLVEGLGAENMGLYGYERSTTPGLARHAADMILFEEAYTSTPETFAAALSLLTGRNPGSGGAHQSDIANFFSQSCTLAELFQEQGFFTVAFTEGRGLTRQDLVCGSGVEKGFVLFDDHCPLEMVISPTPGNGLRQRLIHAGSHKTLAKAWDWIQAHEALQYFLFVRLSELGEPRYFARYGKGFMRKGGGSTPRDVYDTAIAYIDNQVSLFLDQIGQLPEEYQPIIAITSTNGYDFLEPGRGAWRRNGEPKRSLLEPALRIPLLLRIPGHNGKTNKTPVSLIDITPTLIALANVTIPPQMEGMNLLADLPARPVISTMGNPIAQSVRSGKWRFTWQTGLLAPFLDRVENDYIIEFIDVERYRNRELIQDNIRREPKLVEAFKTELTSSLKESFLGSRYVTMAPRAVPNRIQ